MDPITLDILWNRLVATVNEQAAALHALLVHVHRAGVRRPLRRRLRPPGAHDRPGGHRHAGPHQLDGDRDGPLPARASPSTRSGPATCSPRTTLEDGVAAERHHGGDAGLPQRPRSSPSSPTRATPSTSAAEACRPTPARCSRRGCSIPMMKLYDAGRPRSRSRADRGQRAHARGGAGRPPRPGRRQRGGRAAAARVPGRVRPGRHRGAGRRDPRRDRSGPCASGSPPCPTASTATGSPRRLRAAHRDPRGGPRARRRADGRLRRQLGPVPLGINVALNYTRAYTTYGMKCVISPGRAEQRGQLPAGARHRARRAPS